MHNQPNAQSRRQFLQVATGGVIISSSLTSPDTVLGEVGEQIRMANSAAGDVYGHTDTFLPMVN